MIVSKLCTYLLFSAFVTAKFDKLYPGIAEDGLTKCLVNSNYTRQSVTLKANCRGVFKCILDDIDSSQQTILSAGSAILGFVR
jgi:hypothetical protein